MPADSFLLWKRSGGTLARPAKNPFLDVFTTRQAAVLSALREGKSNKIIAYDLSMRESTVKVHVRNIMRKLNAHNRTEVAYKINGMVVNDGYPTLTSSAARVREVRIISSMPEIRVAHGRRRTRSAAHVACMKRLRRLTRLDFDALQPVRGRFLAEERIGLA